MLNMNVVTKKYLLFTSLCLMIFLSCKKDEATGNVVDAVYITSNANTGSGASASTTITNSASGKVSVSPAVARVYVNTLKGFDINVNYTLSGTAVAGTNYTPPAALAVTIPAGKWYADIQIPVINSPLSGNRTIVITMTTASNNVQVGMGSDRNYKTFTYTLTN
ncbi:hypothetical protein [Mucilaginibacter aquatilis]|uniref:DUF1735 domain-containing protein n=1 Tax=Mucilaginibacter aquatilis TaxID=1517760 RepID=A0A6I4ICH7_9SPHI|nr:hypothetical protein [Mucilaginibacter aquatilis]MVN92990.1 hypothetical protein [Mucilaginibacter aquatilis]